MAAPGPDTHEEGEGEARVAAEEAKAEAEQRAAEEQEAKAEAEKAKAEAEQAKAEAEKAKAEAEQRAAEEQEAEQRAAEEKARAEAEQRAAEEKAKAEAEQRERKAEEKKRKEAIQLSASYAKDATEAGIPRQVALYAQWEGSSARATARANLFLWSVFALVWLLVALALAIASVTDNLAIAVGASCGAATFLIAVVAIAQGVYSYAGTLAKFLSEREQVTATSERSRAEKKGRDDDLDELLRLNRTQMQAYQTLSRGQQRSAFRSSLIALFVGLIVLVGGVIVVVVVEGNTSKVAVASVTALGSALSSYIASTYLKLHKEAARQLRFFSAQPIVTSYIYEAERLVTKLPSNGQAATYRMVIKDVLGLAYRDALTFSNVHESASNFARGNFRRPGKGWRASRTGSEPATAESQDHE